MSYGVSYEERDELRQRIRDLEAYIATLPCPTCWQASQEDGRPPYVYNRCPHCNSTGKAQVPK